MTGVQTCALPIFLRFVDAALGQAAVQQSDIVTAVALDLVTVCAAANAARNGVFAAYLAKEGMTGPSEIFEGEKGFFNQVTGPFDLEVEAFGKSGKNFKILDTYIKYYPSEYHSQAGVEAALKLRDRIKVDDADKINIETYDACVDIIAGEKEKWCPQTRETDRQRETQRDREREREIERERESRIE